MKLAGIANTSVAEVKQHLKDAFVLGDKMSTKCDIILCPSYRIFKKWHKNLLKFKGTILLFENLVFLEELECPILDCEKQEHNCFVRKKLDYSIIDKVENKKYKKILKTFPNFVGGAPNEVFCNELFFVLDCSSLGTNRVKFCKSLYDFIFRGKKLKLKKWVKFPYDLELFTRFKQFLGTQKQFLKNCKYIYDLKQQGKSVNYAKFSVDTDPKLYKWLFKEDRIMNTKIVHFGE